jgi:hypothetical protein
MRRPPDIGQSSGSVMEMARQGLTPGFEGAQYGLLVKHAVLQWQLGQKDVGSKAVCVMLMLEGRESAAVTMTVKPEVQ